jgi:lysine 6-dehydrogenase
MKLLIVGSGLMGPAAAFNALSDPQVTQVTLADVSPEQLEVARRRLTHAPGQARLTLQTLDLNNQPAAAWLMEQHDVIVACLPSSVIPTGLEAALTARRPWVDLSWPPADQVERLRQRAAAAEVLVVPGCGVEPGLTEIIARHLADQFTRVDELHIKCGGIPAQPAPPLGYKIVFGGRRLPLRPYDAYAVEGGVLVSVPRYSGVETFHMAGVGEVEAWHEGFVPWLLELEALRHLQVGTQKTIRWPGFAANATVLKELGLLSDTPIQVEGIQVIPKQVVDAVLYPHVRMGEEDRDLTLLHIAVVGELEGHRTRCVAQMVDRYDESQGLTSMARVTAFTGTIIARMVARGEVCGAGLLTPERLISGAAYERLIGELAEQGIRIQFS